MFGVNRSDFPQVVCYVQAEAVETHHGGQAPCVLDRHGMG